MLSDNGFTKQNLDLYLKEVAKEFRKRNGKSMPAEIILIGGASIVINYGFREMTYDVDAIINSASSMKDAINYVRDKYSLPNGWLNADFMKTSSYTPNIIYHSKYYKTFSNIVSFRTITREYLLAMKLMAGRKYKYDLSDVIGILREEETSKNPITLPMIKEAAINLYGSYEALPKYSRKFIERIIEEGNYEELYQRTKEIEANNKEALLEFQNDYPGVLNIDNVDDILSIIRKKNKK